MARAKPAAPPNRSNSSARVIMVGNATFRSVAGQVETWRPFCESSTMSEIHNRLKQARIEAGFAHAADAARAFGWNPVTYRAHEASDRGLKIDVATRYARAFRISTAWLLTGDASKKRANLIKVVGHIGAGATIEPEFEQVDPGGLNEMELPFSVSEDAIAFEVLGDSMWPRYDAGDVIVVTKTGAQPNSLIGREAAITTEDGRRLLKRVMAGNGPETFNLESHNSPTIRDVRLVWSSEVQAVVRRPGT
jgi:phage repressor protein C with HTH and peptisase S24 domain